MRLSGPELEAADEANKLTHLSWVERRARGMTVLEDEELVIVDSGLPSDTFNVVARARLTPASLDRKVEEVVAYFRDVERPFTWWVGPGDRPRELGRELLDRGFVETGAEPGMVADLTALPAETRSESLSPQGLSIARVGSVEDVSELGRVLSALGTPPDASVWRFYRETASCFLDPDCPLRLYLGSLGDRPVATAELTVAGGIVGLYNIATEASHRGKGIGRAMTLRPLLDAREEGFRTAVLQASEDGYRIYERLGFRAWGRFTEYHWTGDGGEEKNR